MTPVTEPLFHFPELASADELVLTGAEARHAAAQRLRPGDAIALFDGRGGIVRGRIARVGRRSVQVDVVERAQAPAPARALELYSAVPKGDRQAVMLDMATQLGMSRFVPVRWERSVVEPGAGAAERWHRICVEACKQSRRAHVPALSPVMTLAQAAARARADGARLLLAHPARDARAVTEADCSAVRLALFVGPEGGVTEEEVALLRSHGAGLVRLNEAILRIETAAVALIALTAALHDRANR